MPYLWGYYLLQPSSILGLLEKRLGAINLFLLRLLLPSKRSQQVYTSIAIGKRILIC